MVKTENKTTNDDSKKKYKGVRMRRWGSYVSKIRAPNQKTRIWLGSYSTPEAAARAYDAALLCLRGPSANFNFPISQNITPQDYEIAVMSPKTIQRIAAEAAASDNVTHSSSSSNGSNSISTSLSSSSDIRSIEEDDHISLAATTCIDDYNQWYNFESPSYSDMVNGVFYDPTMNMDTDFYEDGDIRLWSFC